LLSVQITNSSGERSGFQLMFGLGKESPLNRELLPSGFFDPPRRVILVVTMRGQPHVLMDGIIAYHEIAPSNEPGQSILTITGLDLSQVMDLIDFSGIPYPALPSEGRVAVILAKYAIYGIVPLIVPSVLLDVPNPVEEIPQHQGTDLQYLRKLADEVGYVFYVESGPTPGANLAYWGPEIKLGVPQPALTVNMDAHTNVESLSFSFDGLAKTLYVLLVHNRESKIPIPIPIPDITPLNPPLGRKVPIPLSVTSMNRHERELGDDSTAKFNPIQAAARGLARAAQASNVISGSGSLDVQRYGYILKARGLVGVRGAGVAYDGLYHVRSVTHNIKRGEYKQTFTLTRNAHVSLNERVAV
jgi:hypothetical protein